MRTPSGIVFLLVVSCGGARGEPVAKRGVDTVLESEVFEVSSTLVAGAAPDPKLVEADLLLATDYAKRHEGAAEVHIRALLARMLFEDLRSETSRVPPSAAELAAARAENWLALDRPRGARLLSAFVRVAPLEPDEAAFEIAKKIVTATRGDLAPRDFVAHAEEAAAGAEVAFDVHVPVAEDGRAVPSTTDDASLAPFPEAAVPALPKLFEVGAISDVIGAREGFFVLFTVEILPPFRVGEEEARPIVEAAILEKRLRGPVESLRANLRKAHPVTRSSRLSELLPLAWNTR